MFNFRTDLNAEVVFEAELKGEEEFDLLEKIELKNKWC